MVGYFSATWGAYWEPTDAVTESARSRWPPDTVEVRGKPGPGYVWDGAAWQAPAAVSPAEVAAAIEIEPIEFWAWIARQMPSGVIEAAQDWLMGEIKASPLLSDADKIEALTLCRSATNGFQRSHPLIDKLGIGILGMTAEDIDMEFITLVEARPN